MQRPEHHALRCSRTDPELLDLTSELLDELVGNAVEDVEALYGQARLATVEEPPHARGARGLIKICVVANDHGIRAPELERGALEVARRYGHELLARWRRARKGYLAYQGMLRERLTGPLARACDDVEHTRRQASFVHDLRYPQRRERGGVGGLRNHDVARDQSRTELVAQERRREVPGHYGPYYSQRTPDYEAVGVLVEVGHVPAPDVPREPHIVLQRVHEASDLQSRLA